MDQDNHKFLKKNKSNYSKIDYIFFLKILPLEFAAFSCWIRDLVFRCCGAYVDDSGAGVAVSKGCRGWRIVVVTFGLNLSDDINKLFDVVSAIARCLTVFPPAAALR